MKKIQILGGGCAKCETLLNNAKKAALDLGIEFEIEKITQMDKITDFGVAVTPAIAIDGEVKSCGKVLESKGIEEFLK